ncbi:YiiD C-terminal domain-containing protein [Tengunoibacter tsumagoiensis]|uniref:Thioesterase putative domain-containing protein n=1 Tax=Tengunoibacter tsumagoiensis TaxID=2014871 RepID=A0A401ZW63_9CHLR|nr:YiiD C-terminal domain-containing protein [Tengunoibacter tsumagoiensis]GCE11010.1 hypothetical protein KTT_08690 [Tengunoibacter tsumagoiensis]
MQESLHELQAIIYRTIPITRHMQFTAADYGERGLRLAAPLQENKNLFGTAFAGSLNTLVTLSGWGLLWFILRELGVEGDIVIQDSRCQYLVPVCEDFSAFCSRPGAAQIARFSQTLQQRGRARLEVFSEIRQHDSVAVAFQGRYVVQTRS